MRITVNKSHMFADFVALPAETLHVVPAAVTTDAAVFAEPLAAALAASVLLALGATIWIGAPTIVVALMVAHRLHGERQAID